MTEFSALRKMAGFLAATAVAVATAVGSEVPNFETDVAPLLIKRCVECHQGTHPSGGLLLTSREGFLAGGDSGDAIDPSNHSSSLLLERISSGEMPPQKQGRSQRLPDPEIETLQRWIAAGAPWTRGRVLDYFERTNDVRAGRDWWALQPVIRPDVPPLEDSPQPANPVDAFIEAKLEAEGIQAAPQADRRTLIRRVYYDLIGLPPTEEEVTAFLTNDSPNAWKDVVNRLLALPQYGERWGRHWLDVARYADTSGYERDQEKPFVWKYRDWVVSAFNNDMPYNEFIIQQLAGDEMPSRTKDSVIATGFLRLGTWNDEPNDREDYKYERLEDFVHTTSSAFIAMTVKCARCHAHKFDAITQEDYYRVASAFWPGPLLGDSKLIGGPTADQLGFDDVLGWTDVNATPKPLHVLKNGERNQPLDEALPASPSFVSKLQRPFEPPKPEIQTTHRRLQLAEWIADRENPLTARVFVNRLWQHHFGQAIVRTPNNFGFLADPPTHPKLLDWLAAEFSANGQRMKHIHRLILNSQTWRQSSLHPNATKLQLRDPTNRLWWRSERRRLDAEMLRDSLLAVSGELDLRVGGPGFKASVSSKALEGLSRRDKAWIASPEKEQHRRSLYMYLKRGLLPPMMTTFDLCDPTLSCGKRDVTTVPTQALALMNNDFVHQRSQHLAGTIAAQTGSLSGQISNAWSSILKRSPTSQERQMALQHVKQQRRLFARSVTDSDDPDVANGSLVLHFRADQVTVDPEGRVEKVADLSQHRHDAFQLNKSQRPEVRRDTFGDQPAIWFDGQRRFLKLRGKLLTEQHCSIIAVVSDHGAPVHREIISNWNGGVGNSTTSLFLGLTGKSTVRFSDAFRPEQPIASGKQPFVLSAVNGSAKTAVYQDGRLLGSASALPARRLDTDWVIGQQGNIDGEFWRGGIAEIRVYERELTDSERQLIEQQLATRYSISIQKTASPTSSPDMQALASLCHVLMNSNEFMYID